MLFAYAAGMGSLTAIHLPALWYGATAVLAAVLMTLAVGFWLLAKPASPNGYLWYALLLAGISATVASLYGLVTQMSDFETLQLHNSVTAARETAYNSMLLKQLAAHTGASVLLVLSFAMLFRPQKRDIARIAGLAWGALPALFLLMKLYALVLPAVSQDNMMILFFGWIIVTAAVGYGAYLLTESRLAYTAALALLTLAAPPAGVAAFALFVFLRSLMPGTVAAETTQTGSMQENPQYARQMKTAKAALKQHQETLLSITAELKKINPQAAGAQKKRQALEKEAAAAEMKKIVAEEALERLAKMRG